jgi:glycosyltransferase involved in cell wall biosynthesis
MRILVDYRPALRSRTGVGEYMHALTRAYTTVHHDTIGLFTSSWKDRPAPGTAEALRARMVDRRVPVRVLNYLWHRAEWPPVEWLAGRWDVVHAAHPLLIPSTRAARVITIHDLDFLSHPDRTTAEVRRDYPALAGDHARRADAIVTPSEYTRTQTAARFGVPLDRIFTCSPGAPVWRSVPRRPPNPEPGYVLFMGTLEPRKNVGVLLDAYAALLGRGIRIPRLVLAGRATDAAADWISRVHQPPLAGHVELRGYIADEAREDLYAGARVLVLPSLDEGFGLPVLEAMSAGVPVIASNRGALPEVLADAGVLIEPEDVGGLASAIERIAADEAWTAQLSAAGLARAGTFSWTRAAQVLRTAYVAAVARRDTRLGPVHGARRATAG